MRHLAWLVLCVAVGCGSNSSNSPSSGDGETHTTRPAVGAGDAEGEGAPDKATLCSQAMEAAQAASDEDWKAVEAAGPPKTLADMANAACHLYCGRATECAIDEACAEMSAPEIADLNLDKTAPENTRQCIAKCTSWRLTKEQIQILGTCSQKDSDCATWRTCTDKAQTNN